MREIGEELDHRVSDHDNSLGRLGDLTDEVAVMLEEVLDDIEGRELLGAVVFYAIEDGTWRWASRGDPVQNHEVGEAVGAELEKLRIEHEERRAA